MANVLFLKLRELLLVFSLLLNHNRSWGYFTRMTFMGGCIVENLFVL